MITFDMVEVDPAAIKRRILQADVLGSSLLTPTSRYDILEMLQYGLLVDAISISQDWNSVGNDLKEAINRLDADNPSHCSF